MHIQKLKRAVTLAVLLAAALASTPAARAGEDQRAPELPAGPCGNIQAPAGNKVSFRAYALGVQVYKWNGAGWDFDGPVANLFADDNYRGQVGTHYRGPTWESKSGSKVVGLTVANCTPDPNAIPWLLLRTVSTDGPGIFNGVTFIQRVNTAGGLRPTTPGSFVGEERKVPYTTEYYFYRAEQ